MLMYIGAGHVMAWLWKPHTHIQAYMGTMVAMNAGHCSSVEALEHAVLANMLLGCKVTTHVLKGPGHLPTPRPPKPILPPAQQACGRRCS
jgi:hypothetical protein